MEPDLEESIDTYPSPEYIGDSTEVSPSNGESFLEKAIYSCKKILNHREGAIAGTVGGLYVGAVNYGHGIGESLFCGGKQFAMSFLFSGILSKMCQEITLRYGRIYGSIAPPLAVLGLNYCLHEFTKTPEVGLSVAGPVALSIPLAILLSGFYKHIDENNQPQEIGSFVKYLGHVVKGN